ncbi:MAG: UTP--glucose-1-phosphate uridylyltransferase [Candidatus Harrisonbacteria bacterium CG10_big_fil_rev_8_21_14_0_10_42_17]|uniref:UTP--glucose-1-phosphate uridylyltransferase n=1 Tax=Candidatus Harrisonbacteria bacterium CG10_big_fil_rev_8_21_14_0_10_42_17 TaxID=1974584 RepID=A0A2M6WI00_9BACT|nr:MAG: UTP--glucose-1-phosphate uridylyltransferase [Candidatus Harrisonbacteria bacterium CG10_big_fil_rev_8_21_14_0_10_42_17]
MRKKLGINKIVIPLAGFGTRFLPASKNYPKEMVHLVDKPVIHHIVEEAHRSGIREVIFVLNYSKDVIAKYFSHSQHPHQKRAFAQSVVAKNQLEDLSKLVNDMKFKSIRKTVTLGDGHSILAAKKHIKKNEIFAVSMGDLLSFGEEPFLKQLMKQYDKLNNPVISVQQVSKEAVSRFGNIAPKNSTNGLHEVKRIVERPKPENAPSNLALTGKYILNSSIFKVLEKRLQNHKNGEVKLAHALNDFAKTNKLYAYECSGQIQDTGNKLDFLKATVNFALKNKELGKPFKKFLKSLEL